MELQLAAWLPLAGFMLAASITPGPNNIMLASSGFNYGFRRSVPHLLGICTGGMVMVLLLALGLGAVFARWPLLHLLLKLVCAVYLLYLAWRIATAGGLQDKRGGGKPFAFWQAVLFQWVNPKAWAMALGAVAVYIPHGDWLLNLLLAMGVVGLVNLPSITAWALFGMALKHFLHKPKAVRIFNLSMAGLLIASLLPMLVW